MDLILHRPAVYRHFLFNASAQQRRGNYVKLFLITLFFATCILYGLYIISLSLISRLVIDWLTSHFFIHSVATSQM
jgi:hypothetical protein